MPHCESLVPEFQGFIQRYGTAYVRYAWAKEDCDWVRPICDTKRAVYGICIGGRVFCLPCVYPQTHHQAVSIATAAIRCVRAYRERMSAKIAEWIAQYKFGKEAELAAQANDLQANLLRVQSQIDSYRQHKAVLALRSEPLVQAVSTLLREFLGIGLDIEEKCVEDATLRDEDGHILAVFEIKGVKGNFSRANVNQVASHRERLSLAPDIPGILIMNTIMTASSVEEKDKPPHPDIVKKAVAEKVLVIRTLDLLRYADAVERGVLTAEGFRQAILSEVGWLKVENDEATVVTQ